MAGMVWHGMEIFTASTRAKSKLSQEQVI